MTTRQFAYKGADMRITIVAILVLLALPAGIASASVVLIDNTDCVALDDPHPCCTGAGSGTCDGKVLFTRIMRRHVMVESCRGFWNRLCNDRGIDTSGDGLGDEWLVEAGVCTQQQANDIDPLPTVTCNANKVTDLECRDNDDSGGFLNSVNMPRVVECRKAYNYWIRFRMIQPERNIGRSNWRAIDAPIIDDSDPVEDES